MRAWKRHAYSDEELVRLLIRRGNDVFFEQLYDRYFSKVYYQCLSYVKNKDLAKDLAQEVFIKVYDRLAKFNFKASFTTWIYKVTRNYCFDYLRKEKKFIDIPPEEADLLGITEPPDSEIIQIEKDRLQLILGELSAIDRELLMLKYGYDWQIDEIAEVTELSEGAIKMRIKRAKAKIKHRYEALYPHSYS